MLAVLMGHTGQTPTPHFLWVVLCDSGVMMKYRLFLPYPITIYIITCMAFKLTILGSVYLWLVEEQALVNLYNLSLSSQLNLHP